MEPTYFAFLAATTHDGSLKTIGLKTCNNFLSIKMHFTAEFQSNPFMMRRTKLYQLPFPTSCYLKIEKHHFFRYRYLINFSLNKN